MPELPPVLRRKRVAIPLSVVTVLGLMVVAFVGYGAYTRSKPVDYSRGGQSFALAPTPSPTPSVTAGSTATAATASAKPSGHASSAPSIAASVTAGPTASTAAQPSAVATAVATAAPGLDVPAVGTYQLAVDGSEKVKFGAVSFCHQTLPTRTSLVVSKAVGESKTSYDFDLRYFPGQPGQHDERHIYRYTRTKTYMDYEIATVTCQGVRQTSETSYGTPQIRAELPLKVGQTWHNSGGGSSRTETGTWKVERTENVKVGSVTVPTWVISDNVTFTGSEHGTRSQTWWYSPSWAMPLKWTESIDGARSGAAYSESVTVQVLSRP